jgi:hypothetical protein
MSESLSNALYNTEQAIKNISALSFHFNHEEIDNDDILPVVIWKFKTYRCSYLDLYNSSTYFNSLLWLSPFEMQNASWMIKNA